MFSVGRFLGGARRWRTLAAIFLAGGLCILGSWVLSGEDWVSGLLVELGASFLLFGPLFLVQRRTERRLDDVQDRQSLIQKRQEQTATEISALSDELAQTKDEIQATREELSRMVIARLSEARRNDKAVFQALEDAPSFASLAKALERGRDLEIIARDGPRIELFDTSAYLRFRLMEDEQDSSIVELAIERQDGSPLSSLHWSGEGNAVDVLVQLGEKLQALHLYPGDSAFESAHIFSNLRKLLEVSHERSTGAQSLHNPLGKVVQLCLPQWAITESGIKTIADSPYSITATRLHESHWPAHMRGKSWVDYDSFMQALDDAMALFDAGRLAVKP
ncbi:hypothetical protein [Nonomuraea dietziae]|uniref:hypothetical protein n=1 Tax=Nonomuraea dietziae TaxID=65515 RepID=UPI003406510E